MKADVQRVDRVQITRIEGTYSLVQRFWFSGLDVAAVTDILMSAPLVGKNSLFGNRPGREVPAPDGQRTLQGFSPAPAFEFDVHLQSTDQGVILARFSQPGNQRPYLSGELVWLLADLHNGCLFCEEINTTSASEKGCRPLAGKRLSPRLWLFFHLGHPQVLKRLTSNVARLANRQAAVQELE